MRDMEIRGAGNLLGAEQSGFIGDIGFDLYQKTVEEAVENAAAGAGDKSLEAGVGIEPASTALQAAA